MERIDRQQRFFKKPITAASDGQQDQPRDADGCESACHWLSNAMAMWIQQDDQQPRADQEDRHPDGQSR